MITEKRANSLIVLFFLQDNEEQLLETPDEYKFDRSTRIPRKELDTLINEIITAYDLDQTQGNS